MTGTSAVRQCHIDANFPMFAGALEAAELILASFGEIKATAVLSGIERVLAEVDTR